MNNVIGKVIRIISNKRLIVDVGEDDITIGDKVVVFSESDPIVDLEGNSLGRYEIVKDTLEIVETSELYSVCAKVEIIDTSSMGVVSAMFNRTKMVEADLNVANEDINPLSVTSDRTIKIGDLVRKR